MTDVPQTDPLVSVVVTCFDTDPEQLTEAVASARAQTYPHVELVVVDDGSSRADTRQLLEALHADGVRIVRQDNRGVSAARNLGMRAAAGDLLLPLDGDDVLDPAYLAATVPVLSGDPTVAIVSTRAAYFGERSGLMDLPDPSLPWMVAENSVHNTSLFRRADFDRLGGYDESLTTGFEDHEWWVRLLLDGGTATVLDDVLFHYRIQASSRNASASSSEESLRELRAAMTRNNPAHAAELTSMAFVTLDAALARMHAAEARVARLEHQLGPIVRALDDHPRLVEALERARRLKTRLRRRQRQA